MSVISNNVANVETDEFKKSRAILKEGKGGNVQVDISRNDTPGPTIIEDNNGEMIERELSNVDLSEEIPQMIPTQRGYEANIVAIKTQNEMIGSLLDIIG